MKRVTTIAIAVGLALALGAAVVIAQPYGMGGGMGGGMMGRGMGPGMMGGGMGPGMMGGFYNVEDRLAAQKTALKITPAQETAWTAYADVAKKQSDAMRAQHDEMWKSAPSSAAERSELQSKFMKERVAQIEARNAAFKDLYAVLTPEQRAVFDQGSPMHGPGGRFR